MKKLMIAAASAAVGLGVFAENTPEAYEMNITVKTTTCKAGEGKNVCDDGYTTYRVKANQKIAGLIWGCDCATIATPEAFTTFQDDPEYPTEGFGAQDKCHGYVFWDASVKTKDPYETAEFDWTDGNYRILQCINPKCTECEGLWTLKLSNAEDEDLVCLQGAGFGSAKWSSTYNAAYISSMSGNVTGWAFPGSLTGGCAACGETYTGCSAWAFCTECEEQGDDVPSIAYGTFTLKFKSDVAKKYGKGTLRTAILQAYKFPDAVKAYLVKTDAGYDPEPVVDDCAKAKATLAAYEKELSDLEDSYADLTKQNLAYAAIVAECNATNDYLEAAVDDAQDAYDYQYTSNTGAVWTVSYYDGSGIPADDYGTNLVTFTELINKIDTRMLRFNEATYDGNELTTLDSAKSFAETEVSTTAELKEDLAKAKAALDANTVKKNVATQGIADTTKAIADLDYDNTKPQLNAKIGAQKVVVDQVCD